MAYPGNFARLVVSGTLYGAETFAWGLSVIPDFPSGGDLNPSALIGQVASAVEDYWSTVDVSAAAAITMVKFNLIGPDGRYVSDDETVLQEFDPPVSGVGTLGVPPQIALAISLVTNRARGRGSRGRFYLPTPSVALESNGRLSATAAQRNADASLAFINDLNTIVGDGWRVGVASDVGSGVFVPVTAVRVGRVYDTIRSRRRSLAEDYVLTSDVVP